jgi:DNA-binding CsgD family transcriptional regulator
VISAGGDGARAARQAAGAAEHAAATGLGALEALALHTRVRFGHPGGAAARLAELAARLDSRMVAAFAAHAAALDAGDGGRLAEVGEGYAGRGAMLLAAEAGTQAAAAHAATGRRASARAAAARARDLLAACEDAATPITTQLGAPPDLSRREHEVARLAARGLTNRQIAERLYVSVRTAESHLAQVFTKLGVHRRDELAEVLGDRSPPGESAPGVEDEP